MSEILRKVSPSYESVRLKTWIKDLTTVEAGKQILLQYKFSPVLLVCNTARTRFNTVQHVTKFDMLERAAK